MRTVRPHMSSETPKARIPTSGTRIPKSNWIFGFASVRILACLPLLLIILHGANIPFQNEYALGPLTKAIRAGHASFETFWAPHNEHRIFFFENRIQRFDCFARFQRAVLHHRDMHLTRIP